MTNILREREWGMALCVIKITTFVVTGIHPGNFVIAFRENRRKKRTEITFTSGDENFHDVRMELALTTFPFAGMKEQLGIDPGPSLSHHLSHAVTVAPPAFGIVIRILD